MAVIISEILRHMLTLIFGIIVSAMFLDIRAEKKNLKIMGLFFLIIGLLQGILYYLLDIEKITMIYPVITHIPLLLLFVTAFKKRLFPAAISISTAYMSCQIANWFSAIPIFFAANIIAENIVYAVVLVFIFFIIAKYMSEPLAGLFNKPDTDVVTFGIVPIAYYIFDYCTTVYTEALYEGNLLAVEFSPLLLCILYIVFCAAYFRQYEQKQEADNRNRLIQIKYDHAQNELEIIKRNEKNLALIRHDMRHFLGVIFEYIDNDEKENAKNYISEIVELMDKTTRKRFCSNENINMILSCFEDEIKEAEIEFQYNINIPAELSISEVDMTSILFNCFENAIKAVRQINDKQSRKIELTMVQKNEKLLISMENTFKNSPKFIKNMPISWQEGHGLGTQSIQYTVEKLGGNCHFSAKNNMFTVRIVL